MKELRFTLYDIFGYLLPGFLTLGAIMVTVWTIYWKELNLNSIGRLSPNELGFAALVSYFLGHAMQALGKSIEDVLVRYDDKKKEVEGGLKIEANSKIQIVTAKNDWRKRAIEGFRR